MRREENAPSTSPPCSNVAHNSRPPSSMLSQQVRQQQQPKQPRSERELFFSLSVGCVAADAVSPLQEPGTHPHASLTVNPAHPGILPKHIPRRRHTVINNRLGPAAAAIQIKGGEMQATVLAGLLALPCHPISRRRHRRRPIPVAFASCQAAPPSTQINPQQVRSTPHHTPIVFCLCVPTLFLFFTHTPFFFLSALALAC